MSVLSEVVNVNITRGNVGITRQGFSTILIIGNTHAAQEGQEVIQVYFSIADVLVDYNNTTPEYKAALSIFGQAIKPEKILIAQVVGEATFAETYSACADFSDINFYGVVLTSSATAADNLAVAELVEADVTPRIFGVTTNDENSFTNQACILNSLVAAGVTRTFCIFNFTNAANTHAAAAVLSYLLMRDAGTITMEDKTLALISTDGLTTQQRSTLTTKKCLYYIQIAGVNVVQQSTTIGGYWLDEVFGLDWLVQFIEENQFQVLVNNPKVPFTNDGLALIQNSLQSSLNEAVVRTLLSEFAISMPTYASISPTDRANRVLNNVKFDATFASAIHKIQSINGTVSYTPLGTTN